MADVKTITVGGITYNIKDATARTNLAHMVTDNTAQNINAKKTLTAGLAAQGTIEIYNSNITKGTNPATTQYFVCEARDGNLEETDWKKRRLGIVYWSVDTNSKVTGSLGCYRNEASSTTYASVDVVYDKASNTSWATCPTPPQADANDTKIATTAWVNTRTNNKLNAKFQKVNALPASPDANTWYAIPE